MLNKKEKKLLKILYKLDINPWVGVDLFHIISDMPHDDIINAAERLKYYNFINGSFQYYDGNRLFKFSSISEDGKIFIEENKIINRLKRFINDASNEIIKDIIVPIIVSIITTLLFNILF